jgi:phage terminase large subunit-like protein
VAFDRWGATQLSVEMQEDGLTMVPFGQGFASMSGPTKELEKKLLDREFFNVAYQPQLNTYNGNTNVEFVLADIQLE